MASPTGKTILKDYIDKIDVVDTDENTQPKPNPDTKNYVVTYVTDVPSNTYLT
jgi:hypothetical protein